MAAEIDARNGTLEVGRARKLFDGIVTGRGFSYDVNPDGEKYLVVSEDLSGTSSTRPLTLLSNWSAVLKK